MALLSDLTIDSRFFLAPVGGAGWLAGIWLANALGGGAYIWLGVAIFITAGAIIAWRHGRTGLALAFLAALSFGGARYAATSAPVDPGQIHYYNGANQVIVRGVVQSEPVVSDTRNQVRVNVEEVAIDGQRRPVMGTILVQTSRFTAIAYGDTLALAGDLVAPASLGDPGYAAYLERQGVRSVMDFPAIDLVARGGGSPIRRALLWLKDQARQTIATSMPEPHAALLTGILLGDDSGLPRALNDDFRVTGMTHIIAISGFNIAIIIGLLDILTGSLFPRRTAAVLVMVILGLYAALVGAGASVVRAAIMGITYLVGLRLLGRPTLAMAGLFTAAFLMTMAQPNTLWDVGFQLSFTATLGLMLYAGPWTRWLDSRISAVLAPEVRGRVVNVLAELVVVTLAAQVLTIPLLLYHFGRLSLASLPANLLVLPVQPAIMASGGLTLLLGLPFPAAGQIAGLVAWLFLNYTIVMIRLLAQMPAASVPLPLPFAGLVLIYLSIAVVTLSLSGRQKGSASTIPRPRLDARVVYIGAGVALAGILLFAWHASQPDQRLHIAFLDVGQGDAIFIQTPNGRQLLVDGGRYPSTVLDQLGRQMPFWDRSIDMIIATHPDDDHVAGLVEVVEHYRVSGLITNGADADSDPAYATLLAAAAEREVDIHSTRQGEVINLDTDVKVEIMNPGELGKAADRNDASVVARLTYLDFSVLLTADVDEGVEETLLEKGQNLKAIVLKAGHHGANTSSSSPFLAAVSPQIIIISAGMDNSYGHPHPAMLDRAASIGATVLRTDEMGTLEVITDGKQMWWTAEKGNLPAER